MLPRRPRIPVKGGPTLPGERFRLESLSLDAGFCHHSQYLRNDSYG